MPKGNWATGVAHPERICVVCGKGDETGEPVMQYANQLPSGEWDTYLAHVSHVGSDNVMTPRPEPRKSRVRVKSKGPLSGA